MSTTQPLISVIVPIYKVEAYLQECIDSILAQTFTDFELILVNDGSPDNCATICDQNATKDSRIRVIHQKNQGVTRARANGVTAAQGEFITFVDGDDTLPKHALKTLLEPITDKIDIVIGKHQRIGVRCPSRGEMTAEQYRDSCITLKNASGSPGAKLFRRKLFHDNVFNIPREVTNGEDHIMNINLAYHLTGKAYSIDSVVYTYRPSATGAACVNRTPEKIALYHKYRLQATHPQDIQRLLPNGLADNLIEYWLSAANNRIYLPKSTREVHQHLIDIRRYSNYQFGFLSSVLFCSTSPLIRAIVLLIQYVRKSVRRICNFA